MLLVGGVSPVRSISGANESKLSLVPILVWFGLLVFHSFGEATIQPPVSIF